MVEGELLVRDAEAPYALDQPTTISGQHDTGDGGTGLVTDGVLSSPPISFETTALGQPVYVDARFSQVTPASGTGSIDADGNVSFRTSVTVDLHIEIGDGSLQQDCQATPVALALDSATPYDPETRRVVISDPNFTVPPVATHEQDCISLVASNVNELLAGAGHMLTLTLEGDLELPPPAGCPTTTTLAVDPASSYLGDEVTFDAVVAADPDDSPECVDAGGAVPAGAVEFRHGTQVVGVADLDGTGKARLVTDRLPVGTLSLVARYRGQPPYSASSSAPPITHVVADRPTIVADLPPVFVLGGAAQEFDVHIANSGLGAGVVNGRLDVAVVGGTGVGDTSALVLEWLDGSTWVPVTWSNFGAQRFSRVMPATGRPLPVGTEVTQRLRMSVPPSVGATSLTLTFELIPVDPADGSPAPVHTPAPTAVGRSVVTTQAVRANRVAPTLTLTLAPHTLRQGMVVGAQAPLFPPAGAATPTGTFQVLLDGEVVPIRDARNSPPELGYVEAIDVANGAYPKFVVPPGSRTGTREVTVVYSGDVNYLPAQATQTVTVLPALGRTYECVSLSALTNDRYNVDVTASAVLPAAVKAGQPLSLGHLEVSVLADRGDAAGFTFGGAFAPSNPVLPPESTDDGFTQVDLGFGSLGSATATTVTFANNVTMDDSTRPVDPAPDQVVGFEGVTGSLAIEGQPGDVVPVALETLNMQARLYDGFFIITLTCTPVGDPVSLGSVPIAGTTLTVEGPRPIRVGAPVTLRAAVAPAGTPGTVEFRDGATTLSVVPAAANGTATFTTTSLALGNHRVTATFRAGLGVLSSESEPVEITVLVETECAAFAEAGAGAVVRLVYMELLGRCPDQAGFTYWTGRLDGGTSPEVFARAISRTPEAVAQVVDDAYQTMLGRAPDPAGRTFWTGRLQGSGRYDALLADLGASGEFWSQAGATTTGFVTRVYERLLDRAPDADGLAYWVGRLDAGEPRPVLILRLANLDEPLRRLVVDSYQEILSRVPTTSEQGGDVAHLRGTGDRSGLYARLIGLPEFTARAQGFPNPED